MQLNSTSQGLELRLETTGALEPATTSTVENTLFVNIDNATLALPDDDEFKSVNPVAGIDLITVTSLPNNRVRVAITGLDAPPTAEVRTEPQGDLAIAVTPGVEATEAAEELIEIVVTGEQDEGYNPSASNTNSLRIGYRYYNGMSEFKHQ